MTEMTQKAITRLTADAKNRGWRTAYTGLFLDVIVAILLVLTTVLSKTNEWSEVEWATLGLTVTKSVMQAVLSYVMRRYVDKSKIPTPLPPQDAGPPVEDTPGELTEARTPAKKPAKRARRDRGEVDLLTALGILGVMLVILGLIVSRLFLYVGVSFLLFALILVVANRNRV